MGLVNDIAATYRGPRRVVRRLAAQSSEARALVFLILACALVFLAQWPPLTRAAHDAPDVPLDARLGAALLAWLFIAPLALYLIALVSRGVAQVLGGHGTPFTARIALFWALLAASPLWLLYGLVGGLIGPGPALTVAGVAALGAFVIFWAAGLYETERGGAAE